MLTLLFLRCNPFLSHSLFCYFFFLCAFHPKKNFTCVTRTILCRQRYTIHTLMSRRRQRPKHAVLEYIDLIYGVIYVNRSVVVGTKKLYHSTSSLVGFRELVSIYLPNHCSVGYIVLRGRLGLNPGERIFWAIFGLRHCDLQMQDINKQEASTWSKRERKTEMIIKRFSTSTLQQYLRLDYRALHSSLSLSLSFHYLSLSLFFFSLVFFSCIFSAIYFNFKLYIWCIEEEQTKMATIKRCCLHIGPTVIQRKTLIRAYISLTITPTLSTRWRRQRKSAWSKSSTDASFHSCALSPSFKSVSTMQHFTYKLSCFLTA